MRAATVANNMMRLISATSFSRNRSWVAPLVTTLAFSYRGRTVRTTYLCLGVYLIIALIHRSTWKMNSAKLSSFSGTARVEEGVTKSPNVLLHRSERPLEVQLLKEHTRVVAFREGAH
jgi:hypothetical protein